MKGKTRLLWMKLHTWIACFFLPITVLYVATGVLYLFHIEGDKSAQYSYPISVVDWPKNEAEAKKLILPLVKQHNHGKLPPDFYLEDEYIGWHGYKQEIFIDPRQDINKATLYVNKHDLWLQLVFVHKGLAGPVFWFFGIMLGASLLFSLISGLVIALTVPQFRRSSLIVTVLGFITVFLVFVTGY